MAKRDDIIRKLNSLRDMANHPATEPHLVEVAMRKFNKLMEEYNLTLTDLDVRNSDIYTVSKKEKGGKTKETYHPMRWIVNKIAELSDTKVIADNKDPNAFAFFGLKVDTEYANWLYDLIRNAMEQGSIQFKMKRDYHAAINTGMKGPEIIQAYKWGFMEAINKTLYQMIQERKEKGNALVLVKDEIIQRFIDETVGNTKPGKQIALRTNHGEVLEQGYKEGKKVKLTQGVENNIKGYLN